MLPYQAASELAATTTTAMQALATAAARAVGGSALLGYVLWLETMRAVAPWPPGNVASWQRPVAFWLAVFASPTASPAGRRPPAVEPEGPARAPFASYRSSGGHAAAQIEWKRS